jgi:hypothetical protein
MLLRKFLMETMGYFSCHNHGVSSPVRLYSLIGVMCPASQPVAQVQNGYLLWLDGQATPANACHISDLSK